MVNGEKQAATVRSDKFRTLKKIVTNVRKSETERLTDCLLAIHTRSIIINIIIQIQFVAEYITLRVKIAANKPKQNYNCCANLANFLSF